MPDKMPEDMSDRMPEDLPGKKRINVMVGITRRIFLDVISFEPLIFITPKVLPVAVQVGEVCPGSCSAGDR
jgi:hypothetical protein